jgi:uncharacterized protein (DUF2236 family)
MLKSALDENEAVAAIGKPWLKTYAIADAANVVDRDRLEAALEKIRSRVSNPKHGLFGPGSMMWRVYGEQVTGVGGFRALLLQTAHPYIAHAVQQKSAYRTDPQGRSERTFRAVIDWVYRDLDAAFSSARTVFRVHNRIVGAIANRVGAYEQGDPYAANEQHSAFWVHATGVDSALRLYEYVYGPLSRDERERYNEESKLFALLFGVDEAIIPPTFGDFQEYMGRMFESDVLTPDQASRDIAKYVMSAPTKQTRPTFGWLRIMTAGLLPPRIRHGYQFEWGAIERAVFASSMRALRAGVPRLPPELRLSVFYRRAMHQAMHTNPGPFERRVDRTLERMAEAAAREPERATV